MRLRAWLASGFLAAGLPVAIVGYVANQEPVRITGGFLLVAAVGLAVSLSPQWSRFGRRLAPIPDLMRRPRSSERWCSRCGRPTPRKGACVSCGAETRAMRRAKRRLQRKQRASAQEKKA